MKQSAGLWVVLVVYVLLILAVGSCAEGPQPWVPGWTHTLRPSDKPKSDNAANPEGKPMGQLRPLAALPNTIVKGAPLKQQAARSGAKPTGLSAGTESRSSSGSSTMDQGHRVSDAQAVAPVSPAPQNNTKWFWPPAPSTPPPWPHLSSLVSRGCEWHPAGYHHLNTDTGFQQLTCSNQSTIDDFSKAIFLLQHESIVSVRACSNDKNGYTSVTFITDLGQTLTCGQSPTGGGNPSEPNHPGDSPPPDDHHPGEEPPEDQDPGEEPPEDQNPGDEPPEDQDPGEEPPEDQDPGEEPPEDLEPGDDRRSNLTLTQPGGSHKKPHRNHNHDDAKSREKQAKKEKEERMRGRNWSANASSSTADAQPTQREGMVFTAGADPASQQMQDGGITGQQWQHGAARGTRQHSRSLLARMYADQAVEQGPASAEKRDSPLAETSASRPATWWWWWWDVEEPPSSGNECQEYNSGHLPPWAQERRQHGRRHKPGTAKLFATGGSGAGEYVSHNNKHYFKDYKTYLQHLDTYKASPASLGFVPAHFFEEVYPLASFGLQCDGKGFASAATDFCWNGQYAPPPYPDGVPDVFTLTLDSAVAARSAWPCPSTPAELQQLQQDLNTLSKQLSAASNGLVQEVVWAPYVPSQCQPGSADQNTTITIDGTWIPAPGYGFIDVTTWLLLQTPDDLCDLTINNVCLRRHRGRQHLASDRRLAGY